MRIYIYIIYLFTWLSIWRSSSEFPTSSARRRFPLASWFRVPRTGRIVCVSSLKIVGLSQNDCSNLWQAREFAKKHQVHEARRSQSQFGVAVWSQCTDGCQCRRCQSTCGRRRNRRPRGGFANRCGVESDQLVSHARVPARHARETRPSSRARRGR